MLKLDGRPGQTIHIGDTVSIRIIAIRGATVTLGITAKVLAADAAAEALKSAVRAQLEELSLEMQSARANVSIAASALSSEAGRISLDIASILNKSVCEPLTRRIERVDTLIATLSPPTDGATSIVDA